MSLSKGSVDLKQVSTTLISRFSSSSILWLLLKWSNSKIEFQYRASDMLKEKRFLDMVIGKSDKSTENYPHIS